MKKMFVTFQKIQTDTWRRVKQVIIGAAVSSC